MAAASLGLSPGCRCVDTGTTHVHTTPYIEPSHIGRVLQRFSSASEAGTCGMGSGRYGIACDAHA
jgi:hypothetical protein